MVAQSWGSGSPGQPPREMQDVRDLLAYLSARHREVVGRRFGLDGKAEHSLADIGRQLGITHQRTPSARHEGVGDVAG